MEKPPSPLPTLPTGLEQRLVRLPQRRMSAGGMLAFTVALWVSVYTAWMTIPRDAGVASASFNPHAQTSLVVRASTQSPRLVMALAEPFTPPPLVSVRRDPSQDIFALVTHVARTLLRDEFDSVMLKMSLGWQVAHHLKQDLTPLARP